MSKNTKIILVIIICSGALAVTYMLTRPSQDDDITRTEQYPQTKTLFNIFKKWYGR